MYDLIIRRAQQVDGALIDIAISAGKIAAIGELPAGLATQRELDLAGRFYISAGWIDSHVHCYTPTPVYFDEPDLVGVANGVTTVVDAGSSGSDHVDEFYALTRAAKTNVYALLNVSRSGLRAAHELADIQLVDKQSAGQAIDRHPDFIIGLKARISSSVVGSNGVKPLLIAKEIQREHRPLPLMVHVGNNPPDLDEIADLLECGDIVTHCYNGKPNRILTPAGQLRASVQRALQRGVLLDIGHGSASFSFEVAAQAIALGILPHTISSDLYCTNRISGPVHSLAHVMSKFFTLGMTLPQVIACVTDHVADALHLSRKGRLLPQFDADLTVFSVREESCLFIDSEGQSQPGERQLIPQAAIVAGEVILTDEGKLQHVFDL